jgi:hypothetical protein
MEFLVAGSQSSVPANLVLHLPRTENRELRIEKRTARKLISLRAARWTAWD